MSYRVGVRRIIPQNWGRWVSAPWDKGR